MENKIPKATHVGDIHIGNKTIPCAVLEDGTRLLTQEGFLKAIGRSGKPAKGRGSVVEKVAPFLALDNLKPFINKELESSTFPVIFQPIKGGKAYGYKAELLPKVCEIYLQARDEGVLLKTQLKFAIACDILMRGLAHIGIIALVDEATGYQEIRDRIALQKILDKFLLTEYAKWAKRFPDVFYQEIFRLNNWEYMNVKRPGVIGRYTNDIVYERLAPNILDELRIRNPKDEKGHRKAKHHQWLTVDIGHEKLQEHLTGVIALMKASSNWRNFIRLLERAYPKFGHTIPMNFGEEIE